MYKIKKGKVLIMKCVSVDYSVVAPSVLESVIRKACPMACVMSKDIDEDTFEVSIVSYGKSFTPADLVKIEEVLAQYV